MINGHAALHHTIPAHHSSHIKCEVCDCEITYPDSLSTSDLDYSVCRSFDCRRIMSQKSSMTPLMFKSHLLFNKKLIRQRREKDAARKKYIDEIIDKEQLENQKIFQFILNENSELSENNTHLLVIPSGCSKLVSPSNKRIEQYIDHLNSITAEAAEYTNASEVIYDEHHDAHGKGLVVEQRLVNKPELRSISDKLCSMCRGGCCASGKEHAYLSVFTMRTYMDENPHEELKDILDLYISKISNLTIENSCINHTARGCALPRELRSDICNGYYCDSLKSYQKQMETSDNTGVVLAVQRSSTYWSRLEPGVSNEVVNVALIGSAEPDPVTHT